MKLTAIPYSELPVDHRAIVDEMIESNAEEIAQFRKALRCPDVHDEAKPKLDQ